MIRQTIHCMKNQERMQTIKNASAVLVIMATICLGSANPIKAADPAAQPSAKLNFAALQQATGAPPAPNSPQDHDDVVIVRWLQAHRSPEQIANSWQVLTRELLSFDSALGTSLTESSPVLSKGLLDFVEPINQARAAIKEIYKRPRPFVAHADIKPCVPKEPGYSFPSGHATFYSATSTLLADLLPERQERIKEVGKSVGANRVICAMHYPSDIEAGVRLGKAGAEQILQSPAWKQFKQQPAVQAEIRAIQAIPAESLPLIVR